MSASSRNLAPLLGDMFPWLPQARFPSGPLRFERGLTHRSLARPDFGSTRFFLRAMSADYMAYEMNPNFSSSALGRAKCRAHTSRPAVELCVLLQLV